MTDHLSNPAGRLWLFLSHTVKPENQGGAKLRGIWSGYFKAADDAAYLKGMVGVLQLPDEIEGLVKTLDDPMIPQAQLLRPVPTVRTYLIDVIKGDQTVSWARSAFNAGILNDLEACSHQLRRASSVSTPDENQREQIRALVLEVIELAGKDGDLDAKSREAILRFAHRLLQALDLFNVWGSDALVSELDRFRSEYLRLEKKPGRPLGKKLLSLAGTIVMAVGLYTAPADVSNAIESYDHLFAPPSMLLAPGAPEGDGTT